MSEFADWVPGNPNDRSVTGFRIRHGSRRGPMSRATYYRLKREGKAPKETNVTPTTLIITADDERAWELALANPTDTEAKLIEKVRARRLALTRKAAAVATASPRHVGKRKTRGKRRIKK